MPVDTQEELVSVDNPWCFFESLVCSFEIYISPGQFEINDVDLIGLCSQPHQEVRWLDIPVHKLSVVHGLQPIQQLIGYHYDRLQTEFLLAIDKQMFQ